MNQTLTLEEKTMAVFSHASIILMFIGPIIPLIMWSSTRKKSRFAAFQSLQAVAYQLIVLWAGLLIVLLGVLIAAGGLYIQNTFFTEQPISPEAMVFLFERVFSTTTFITLGLFSLLGFVGAYQCGRGQNFYYPYFGKKLEKYLTFEDVIVERNEEQVVAAACHSTALIQPWGIFTPLLTLNSLKEKSPFLQFQATQALWLQISALIFLFVSSIGFLTLVIIGALGFMLVQESNAMGIILVFSLIVLIYLFGVLLILPLFHLYAFIASWRVLQGQDYKYPLIGKIIARRLEYKT